MQQQIERIVIESLIDLNEELESERLNNPSRDTQLYSEHGVLDSLALVLLITDLEEKISEEFDKDIILADEKAMSQRTSPFRSVESLVNYIHKLIEE